MRRALLLALLLAAPLAGAHISSLTQGAIVRAGPYSLSFSPSPESPYTNETVGLTAEVAEQGLRARNVRVVANVTSPDGAQTTAPLVDDGTGYLVGTFRPTEPGTYAIRLDVRNMSSGEVHSGETSIDVFREMGFRIRSLDPNLDIVAGQTTTLAFETVDPITLQRKDAFKDLTLTIEHWTSDHKTFLDSVVVPMDNPSPGLFKVDHVFAHGDSYLLRFSSQAAGFKPDDAPKIHVDATTLATPPSADTPLPVGLVALAVVVAVLARRR